MICRNGAAGRTASGSYALPVFQRGSTAIQTQSVTKQWCPPGSRKRPIDLVLLSLGGNDVGFSALAAYALTENAGDIAPIVQWIGSQIRFGPNVSRVYLNVLDERFKALRDALRDGFGIEPARVVHTSYEPIQFDETGQVCGAQPDLGMDVHPKIRLSQARLGGDRGFPERVPGAPRMHLAMRAVAPIARRGWRPGRGPASTSSPSISRNSPAAASARAIRSARPPMARRW